MKKLRHEEILSVLSRQGYATVKELVLLLRYSSATINRDLNEMQRLGLVKRSYGGVEATGKAAFPPLPARYDLMKKEKRHIGKAAAALIENGDTIFIDASTTASYIAPYLEDKRDIHIITNNMQLAIRLAETDVRVTVLGGEVLERPSMLPGALTVENATRFRADKAFFSTSAFTEDGEIGSGDTYYLLQRVFLSTSQKSYFLVGKDKRVPRLKKLLCSFGDITGVISDYDFPAQTKERYPHTAFLLTEE